MVPIVFLLFVTLLTAPQPLYAAVACPSSAPTITLSAQFIPATPIVRDKNSSSGPSRSRKHIGLHNKTVGITQSELTLKIRNTFSLLSANHSPLTCVTLREVTIIYGFGKTPVLIDKKYRPGSCEYSTIHGHEMAHIQIMNRYGSRARRWLQRQMTLKLHTIKPVLTKNADLTQQQLAKRIEKMASTLVRRINKDISDAHREIDTPESYQRSQARCSHW